MLDHNTFERELSKARSEEAVALARVIDSNLPATVDSGHICLIYDDGAQMRIELERIRHAPPEDTPKPSRRERFAWWVYQWLSGDRS